MGFLNHGGMWSDLIILSVATGLAFPYFSKNRLLALAMLLVALVATVIAHAQWAKSFRAEGITGHMFPVHETGKWYLDISKAGWMHVLVMTALLAAIFMSMISPLPEKAVISVSFLFTAHVFLATLQPGWYCTGILWTWKNVGPPLVAAALIWIIAVLKIQHARGS